MDAILHVDLVQQTGPAFQLRLWRDNPNQVRTRTLALEEIADLVEMAETDYYSPLPPKLAEVGRRLFRWLDGGERWISGEMEKAANQARVLVLAIATPERLAHLPWEVLHDDRGFLVHALNPPVLPVRWRPSATGAHATANRPLQILFMASSPENVKPVLAYEAEEHEIIEATKRSSLDLVVEESGCVEELGALLQDYGAGFFDVLHLTGHAGHKNDGTPVFHLEDSEGRRADATAVQLARELPDRPPLVFLSGCRTGQAAVHGEVRSFAEQLIDAGFRSVLGWGRPVRDTEATLAARQIYQHLAAGESLPFALTRAYAELYEAGARDWHLLRLFCAGDPPGGLVTPLRTPGRKRPAFRPAETEFLDPLTKKVKVATRASFVGRRRLLQQSLRLLRQPEPPHVGLLLRGQGGRGKSSVAARLCDRLRRELQRVVIIGRLDEPNLTNAWADTLPDDAMRQALRDPSRELRFRIQSTLIALADMGLPAPLFVLDDFEQNQEDAKNGDLQLATHAADALLPLLEALEDTGTGRVLITCRYALPKPFADYLHLEEVPPLDATERMKQLQRLDQNAARRTSDPALLAQAMEAADGNPRLFEWLHSVLEKPGLDHAAILAEMQEAEEKFREDILARSLIASLPEDDRVLLGRMLLLTEPVPLAAVHALAPNRGEAEVRKVLERAADLSLVDVTHEDDQAHYRVPRQLGGGDPPLLPLREGERVSAHAGHVFDELFRLWPQKGKGYSEARVLEMIRLAAIGGRKKELVLIAKQTTTRWLSQYRNREVRSILEAIIEPAGRHHTLLLNLARAVGALGDGDAAGEFLEEASAGCPADEGVERSNILHHYANWLIGRGRLDESLHILQTEKLPLVTRLNDVRSQAITLGQIADVLAARGELDESLRIRREEELPVYERLGDVSSRAVTLGQIADVLEARGEVDEALRIRREEELPVYERLGDVRSRAVTQGKIADVLVARGELDEALRIYREEVLPALERLGDVRSRAVAQGKIADVLKARGELEEALRIRREEQLPVYERLGDVRSRAVTQGKIADVLVARGELDEALRIRREEELPVYERLGDVRSRAVTQGQIADVLAERGELDEALRIRREEELPVYGRLGDVRSRAVTQGKIADVLAARGELDEALRIRREEELPVYERLGDVRSLIIGRVNLAFLLFQRGREEDFEEVLQNLVWGYKEAAKRGYAEAAQIADFMRKLGFPMPERQT